jgi:hypothetical protein
VSVSASHVPLFVLGPGPHWSGKRAARHLRDAVAMRRNISLLLLLFVAWSTHGSFALAATVPGRAPLSIPLFRRDEFSPTSALGRLLLSKSATKGKFEDLAYFYADLSVGTPAQTVSVILDSGSSTLAFPCDTCQSGACGIHPHTFNTTLSNSIHHAECDVANHCSSCDEEGLCLYEKSYTEGSAVGGVYVRDVVAFGPSPGGASVVAQFGCHTRETGLFRTQDSADGVLGLSQGPLSVIRALVQGGAVDRNVFSLCFSDSGGVLALGGANEDTHLAASQATHMQISRNSGWYVVGLAALRMRAAGTPADVAPTSRRLADSDAVQPTGHAATKGAAFRHLWPGSGVERGAGVRSGRRLMEAGGSQTDAQTASGKHVRRMGNSRTTASGKEARTGGSAGLKGDVPPRRSPRRLSVTSHGPQPRSLPLGQWASTEAGFQTLGTPAVVDTGSSFSYLPPAATLAIIRGIEEACAPDANGYSAICGYSAASGSSMPTGQAACYRFHDDDATGASAGGMTLAPGDPTSPAASAVDRLPWLDLQFADGAVLTLSPRQYLVAMTWMRPFRCLAMYSAEHAGGRIILGANALMHHDVTLDTAASRMHFAPARCPRQAAEAPATAPSTSGSTGVQPQGETGAGGAGGSTASSASGEVGGGSWHISGVSAMHLLIAGSLVGVAATCAVLWGRRAFSRSAAGGGGRGGPAYAPVGSAGEGAEDSYSIGMTARPSVAVAGGGRGDAALTPGGAGRPAPAFSHSSVQVASSPGGSGGAGAASSVGGAQGPAGPEGHFSPMAGVSVQGASASSIHRGGRATAGNIVARNGARAGNGGAVGHTSGGGSAASGSHPGDDHSAGGGGRGSVRPGTSASSGGVISPAGLRRL